MDITNATDEQRQIMAEDGLTVPPVLYDVNGNLKPGKKQPLAEVVQYALIPKPKPVLAIFLPLNSFEIYKPRTKDENK